MVVVAERERRKINLPFLLIFVVEERTKEIRKEG